MIEQIEIMSVLICMKFNVWLCIRSVYLASMSLSFSSNRQERGFTSG